MAFAVPKNSYGSDDDDERNQLPNWCVQEQWKLAATEWCLSWLQERWGSGCSEVGSSMVDVRQKNGGYGF